MDQLAAVVGGAVYPLGEADGGHGVIGIDAAGCAYLDYLHLLFVTGPSLDELIVRVLLGLEHPPQAVLADLRVTGEGRSAPEQTP